MTDRVEQTLRDGIAELVRDKPDLGRIDVEAVAAGSRRGSGRAMTRWLAVAAALVVLVGLGAGLWFGPLQHTGPRVTNAEPASPATSLTETTWLTSQIKGQDAVFDARGQVPYLTLLDKNVVLASDTCNGITGAYELDGDRLTLRKLAVTTSYCGDRKVVLSQRRSYLDALDGVARLALQGSTLTLFDNAGTPLLVFHAADPRHEPVNTVQVRVRNDSPTDLENVQAQFADGTAVDYGTIASGQHSDYQDAGQQVYGYAPIRATADGEDLAHGVIDYLGETPLPPGRYTYVLTVDRGALALRLEVDQ